METKTVPKTLSGPVPVLKSHEFSLTENEKAKLAELKALLDSLEASEANSWAKAAKEQEVVRFLRGHKQKPDLAQKMIVGTSKWRHERSIEDLMTKSHAGNDVKLKELFDYYPSGMLGGNEVTGEQVCLQRLSMVDFPSILKNYTVEHVAQVNTIKLETLWREHPRGDHFIIIDLGHCDSEKDISPVDSVWQLRSYIAALMKCVKHVAQEVEPNYPETFKKIFFVRVPSVFWASWKVAKYFVAERTRNKIEVVSSDAYKVLKQHIADEHIPHFLGGKNDISTIPKGGKLMAAEKASNS